MSEKKTTAELIEEFLREGPYAVVGASTHPSKYGNRVFRMYLRWGREVYPINPHADEVEGHRSYASLSELPVVPRGISVVTPPEITEKVVEEAARLGVEYVWMQPGAESHRALQKGEEAGLGLIGDGSCVLVEVGRRGR